jgi:hypothetical protein
MRPVESIPGMVRGRIKENDGEGQFNYDILLRTFVNVKCTSLSTTIIKKEKKVHFKYAKNQI